MKTKLKALLGLRRQLFVLLFLAPVNLQAESGFWSSEFVAPALTYPMNHGSSLVDLGDDRLLVCWFAGSGEAQRDVEIVCSQGRATEAPSRRVWSTAKPVVKAGERATDQWLANKFIGNPVLHLDHEGVLWLFYEAVQIGGHSGAAVHYKTSHDSGLSWSNSSVLAGGSLNFGHLPRNKPLVLADGRVLLPLYREFTSHYGYTMTLSLAGGAITHSEKHVIPGSDHLQPSLVQSPDGTAVFAYLRNKKSGMVLVTRFDLDLQRWSKTVPTNLPNPNAAVDGISRPDRSVLLVYNDSHTDRTPLSLAWSADGVRFIKIADLENEAGQSYAYPAIIRSGNGRYDVTYTYKGRSTIKHISFDDAWVESRLAAARR